MARRANRFTVYDAMEAKGDFDSNPANSFARDSVTGDSIYKGPVEYPKMLYHPTGNEKIVVPAEIVNTPFGPQRLGEQKRLINVIVKNEEEEGKFLSDGWHQHPSQAIRARLESEGKDPNLAPKMSNDDEIKVLKAQIAQLLVDAAKTSAGVKPAISPSDLQ